MKKSILLLGILCLFQSFIFAQIKSPEEFIGYPLGEKYILHYEAINYIQYLENQSNKVKLEKYGETPEGRPLYLMYLASAENIKKLDEIRTNNLKNAGILEGSASTETPAIVWMAYDVHGNEASCTPAGIETVYQLLQNKDLTNNILDNTVVVIDICVNPDGYSRYVNWMRQVSGKKSYASLDAREHVEPWARGRYNHYLFDMNRDWAWQSQHETQIRVKKYNEWLPHIYGDFHEMGINAPYYFAPAAEPFHEEITDFQREFQTKIGQENADYFDKKGWLYFTRERFDLLYPSYGDTWTMFNGAIGMTYEQAGNHQAGIQVLTEVGDTLTLKTRIAHHVYAGLVTIKTASDNKDKLVKGFNDYYKKSQLNPSGKYKTFVIKGSNNPDKIKELTQYLDRQNIKYGKINNKQNTQGFNYQTNKIENVTINSKDLVINTYQPKSTLIKVLFNPKTVLKDSVTYDATAWALPYAFGLEVYAITSKLEVYEQKYEIKKVINQKSEKPVYAFLSEWKSFEDAKFLAQLLQKGIRVRFSKKKIIQNQKTFEAGTLVILRADNENQPNFEEIVQKTANQLNRQLTLTTTGLSDNNADLGSTEIRPISIPRIAVVAENGISTTGFGTVWHFMEQQLDFPVTVFGTSYFNQINLNNYDVLIIPEINGFGKSQASEKIRKWVKNGGKLILLGNACQLGNSYGLKTKMNNETGYENIERYFKKYDQKERKSLENSVAGAIFKVQVDNSHPLAYGYENQYFTLKNSSKTYNLLEFGWNTGVIRKNAWIDGFVGYKLKLKLTNTPVFGTNSLGKGNIVYFIDNPIFRASWQNGRLLFTNALFFVGK